MSPNILRDIDELIIIRSANMALFKDILSLISNINPNVFLHIVVHKGEATSIKENCINDCNVIEYEAGGTYNKTGFSKINTIVKEKGICKALIVYNDEFGIGYENLEEILLDLDISSYLAFNCYQDLYSIKSSELAIKSLILEKAIQDWFWEYLLEIEEKQKNETSN